MLYFNSCPRCKNGTVQLESDFFGSYLSCLNCGFEKSAASVRKIDYEEMRREGEDAVAVPVASSDEGSDLDEYEDLDADDDELIELERAAG